MAKELSIRGVSKSPRAAMVDLLAHCENGAYANDIVPARLSRSNFSDSDKALITKIVYSTLRQQIRIDFAINKLTTKPVEELDAIARNALRSIACQCVEGIGAYAAVDETVKVMPFKLKGFVNAVARKIAEQYKSQKLFIDEPKNIKVSLPVWIVDEVEAVFGDDEVFLALNLPAQVSLAPISDDEFVIDGAMPGAIFRDSLLIKSKGNIADLDPIKNGQAVVIDQGSRLVAQCVDVQSGQNVLDVCSAPGGKSILLSQNTNYVIANDLEVSRLTMFKENIERCHIKNISLLSSDARNLPLSENAVFDRVLIDAPCSGLGVLRRRPDARNRISQNDVEELSALQKEIIQAASKYVKSGGKLIYSVCTFTKQETTQIDQWLENELKDFEAEVIDFKHDLFSKAGRGYLLAPTAQNDAMYVLRLVRS